MLKKLCILVYCVVSCGCFYLAPTAASNSKGKQKYAKSVSDEVIHAFSADTANKDNWTSLSKLKPEYSSPDEGTDEGRLLSEIPWIQSDEGNKGFFAVQCHNFLEPHELVTPEELKKPFACDLTQNRTYIIHIARWNVEGPPKAITYALKSSDWYVYESRGPKRLVQVKSATPDAPTLVGYRDALLFGIHIFDFKENNKAVFLEGKDSEIRSQIRLKYTTSAQRTVPQNVQNLASVIAAISKATIGTSGSESVKAAPEPQNVLVLVAIAPGAKGLPYKFTLGATLSTEKPGSNVNDPVKTQKPEPDNGKPAVNKLPKSTSPDSQDPWDWNLAGLWSTQMSQESVGQAKNPSTAKPDEAKPKEASSQNALDCSSVGTKDAKPCTFSRTFQVQEKEWWDVSLGVTVPGVRQTQYTADTTVHSKSTTHTNVYAFLDFGFLNTKPRLPHFSVGLPVSGQVFYRPFFGVGESITTLPFVDRLRFPLKFGVFVGVVYARQQTPKTLGVGAAATSSQLAADLETRRVAKLLVGLDFSVGELIGRIKPK